VREASKKHRWHINFVLKPAAIRFDPDANLIYPTVWIWYFAAAGSRIDAIRLREELIDSIFRAVSHKDVLAMLTG
jgi:hypothetical protein